MTSTGPVILANITDNTYLAINAVNATLTGTITIGSMPLLRVAAVNNATFNLNTSLLGMQFLVPAVTNTTITSNAKFTVIESKQWLNTDGGTYTITAPGIDFLDVTGTFAEGLSLSSTNYDILVAKVTAPSATWSLAGSVLNAKIASPTTGWSLTSDGLLRTLAIQGNLANNIVAAAITSMTVSGTTTNSTIQTNATFSKKFLQIGHIGFTGAVSSTVVFSAGNIGTITAPSLTDSRIYAGVNLTVAQNGALAAAPSDLSADAKITSVTLGKGTNAFADVLITADIIGTLNLGKINTSNNGVTEGIAAHTITSIAGTLVPGGVLKASPAQLKTAATLAAYEKLAKLTLGDFTINLF